MEQIVVIGKRTQVKKGGHKANYAAIKKRARFNMFHPEGRKKYARNRKRRRILKCNGLQYLLLYKEKYAL